MWLDRSWDRMEHYQLSDVAKTQRGSTERLVLAYSVEKRLFRWPAGIRRLRAGSGTVESAT